MPKGNKHIAALDIGTTEVRAIVGEVTDSDGLEIIGIGRAPSRGVRKAVVVNIEATVDAIKRAVEVGFGVSITPRSAVQRELQAGTLSVVPVDAVDAQITSSWAQYSGRKLSAPARVFVDVLEQRAVSR